MALAQDTLKVGSTTVPIVSKGMGKQETLGGSASQEYTVGKYFVGNDGYYYLVSQTIAQGGTITVGANCTKTDLAAELVGKAPTNHKSAQTTYGVGDANNYGHVKVDTALSADSTNPVQNKVVNTALGTKAPTNHASAQTTYGVGSTTNYGHVKVDDALSASSTNPVQNKKVYELKQALSNEVVTRAELGAHNIMPLTLDKLMALNPVPTWDSGNVYSCNGVTYTITLNSNGQIESIKVNGTSTALNGFILCTFASMNLENGKKYVINGCQNQVASKAYFQIQNSVGGGVYNVPATGYTFTYDSSTMSGYKLAIRTDAAQNPSNIYFYPMIRIEEDADTTYQPYAKTNVELTKDDNGLTANAFANGAVNLFQNKATNTVNHGITIIVNSDGSVTASGTNDGTDDTNIYLCPANSGYENIGKPVKMSGCPAGGSAATYLMAAYLYDGSHSTTDIGQGSEPFTITSSSFRVIITIKKNTAISGSITFKPMITVADMPNSDYQHYVPYAKSNRELTDAQFLNGILGTAVVNNFTDIAEYTIPNDGWYYLYLQTNVASSGSSLRIMLGSDYPANTVAQHRNSNIQYESAHANLPLKKGTKVVFKCTDTSVSCQYQAVPIT